MLAGHTLLHILANSNFFIFNKKIIFFIFSFTFIFLIGLLEVLIAFIQSYVFLILLTIYFNDAFSKAH
jgi:F0F1-type ATP synthase membrane subunit a